MSTGKRLAVLFSFVFCLFGCSSSPHAPIEVSISPRTAYIGSGQTMQFTVMVTSDSSGVIWTVTSMDSPGAAGVAGGAGSLDANGNFTAPTVTQNSTVSITATSVKDPTKSASASVTIIAPGVVASTANAQVAQYTITVPDSLSAFVQFSTDTGYGLKTWSLPAPSGGGDVPVLVAGMKGNTPYHMRAVSSPPAPTPLFLPTPITCSRLAPIRPRPFPKSLPRRRPDRRLSRVLNS